MANIMTPSIGQLRFAGAMTREVGRRRDRCPFDRFVCLNSGSEAVSLAARLSDINAKLLTDPGGRHAGRTTKAVALECAQEKMNVRVNSVHPGIIDTDIWNKIPQGGTSALQSDLIPEGANTIDAGALGEMAAPLGFAGIPADIANGIVFLASDESRYMTGSELVIDGGMTAR